MIGRNKLEKKSSTHYTGTWKQAENRTQMGRRLQPKKRPKKMLSYQRMHSVLRNVPCAACFPYMELTDGFFPYWVAPVL